MIPITENTTMAVAALIYNYAYDQDPDSGWCAGDESSAPGNSSDWLEWSTQLCRALQEKPKATDEQVIAVAKKNVNTNKAGIFWDTIWMTQSEEGDVYSSMSEETDNVMNIVRDFLHQPGKYVEVHFIENDLAYLAYLESPLGK